MNASAPAPRLWFSWLTFERLLTLILFIAILAMAARIPTDTDSWWHLQSGRWIITHRTIPTADPFSHTRAGEPWIDHGWLAQAIIFLFWDALGYAGLVILLMALVTAAFYFAWLQCRQANKWLRAFVLVIAAVASGIIWAVRPQMVSFLLTSVVAFLLYRYKQGARRAIWWLPFVMLIWVNTHGGFAIGFILMVAYLFGEMGNQLLRFSVAPVASGEALSLPWADVGRLALVTLLCFLILPLNPNGFQMWSYPFRTVGIGVLQDFILEWQAPNFHELYLHPFIWLLLAALTAFGLAGRRADFTDLTLVALFGYLSLLAVRNIPIFALVTAPVIARVSTLAWTQWRGERGVSGGRVFAPFAPGLRLTLNWALLLLVALAALARIGPPMTAAINEADQAEQMPVGAVAFLGRARPPGPLFNDYNWGGYLIWRLPEYPVFVDGRTDLYDDAFLRDYLLIDGAGEGWQAKLDAYGVNLVLVSVYSPLARALTEQAGWQMLYADNLSNVFARRQ